MKMNCPVDCKSFFRDQILQKREGVWCVSLSPSGQILSLFEAKIKDTAEYPLVLKVIKQQAQTNIHAQILVVRINPSAILFDSEDWAFISFLKMNLTKSHLEFCDYLKIGTKGYCSLINYDY